MERQIPSTIMIAALLLATSAPPSVAATHTDQTQQIVAQNGSTVSGHGSLIVNSQGADVVVRAENLTPGFAYTAWFVYFDNTANCLVPQSCAPADLIMPATNPAGVFGRMDSAVAGSDGQLTFKGTLRDFRVSDGSAIHIALFSHGTVNTTDYHARAQQMLTPETPALGAPGEGLGTEKGFLVAAVIFDIASSQ